MSYSMLTDIEPRGNVPQATRTPSNTALNYELNKMASIPCKSAHREHSELSGDY